MVLTTKQKKPFSVFHKKKLNTKLNILETAQTYIIIFCMLQSICSDGYIACDRVVFLSHYPQVISALSIEVNLGHILWLSTSYNPLPSILNVTLMKCAAKKKTKTVEMEHGISDNNEVSRSIEHTLIQNVNMQGGVN